MTDEELARALANLLVADMRRGTSVVAKAMEHAIDGATGIDPLMTTVQVAKHLGVMPATVGVWVKKGRLKCTRIGDEHNPRVRFRRSDVDAFAVERKPRGEW